MDGLPQIQLPDPPPKKAVKDNGLPDPPKKAGGAGSPHDFGMGYKPTPQDIAQRKSLDGLQTGLEKPQTGSNKKPDNGSWANLPTVIERKAFQGFGEDISNMFGFLKDKTNWMGQASGIPGAMGAMQDYLKQGTQKDQQVLNQNKLPNTTMGKVANTVAGFGSDIGELALTPEFKIGKLAKLGTIGSKAVEMAVGKFPLQQATKTMLQRYTDAKDKGEDPDLAALKGFGEGYKNGYIFELAGAGASKLTKLGTGALEKVGLMAGNKFVAGGEKRLLNAVAQGLTFSAAPTVQNAVEGKGTTRDEIQSNLLFGTVTGALFGAHGEGEHTEADKAAAKIIMQKPLIDLHNFVNADNEDIKNIHKSDVTAPDLQAQSAAHAEAGFKATDPDEKAKSVVASSLTGKASSIKSVTDAILKDKDAVIDWVNQLPDIEYADKQKIIDKINQVHKEIDPVEQRKTELADQIKDLQDNPGEGIIEQKENKLKLNDLNTELDGIIKKQHEAGKATTEVPVEAPKEDATAKEAKPDSKTNDKGGDNQLNTNDAFQEAAEKSKKEVDPSHLGKWIVDNAKDGDKIHIDEDSYWEVKRNKTKKGFNEIILTHFSKDDDGSFIPTGGRDGVKILSDKYDNDADFKNLGYKGASDLFESGYTNSKGERIVTKSTYEPKATDEKGGDNLSLTKTATHDFPLLGGGYTTQDVADKAFVEYENKYGKGNQPLNQIKARGGFSPKELDMLTPGWRNKDNAKPEGPEAVTPKADDANYSEKPNSSTDETSWDFKGKSDKDLEKRMNELDDAKSFTPEREEYNRIEKEMEKRERESVFNVPLDKASDAIDALLKKNKEMPNGYGAFIEKRDARESKAVIDKYTNDRAELSNKEVIDDFKGALLGNPDTWYADGLKLRESAKLASERGININDLLSNVEKEFTDDGFSSKDAKEVIGRRLSKIINSDETTENNQIKFKTSRGSEYTLNEDNTTTRIKNHGEDSGQKEVSKKTYFISKEDSNKLAEIQAKNPESRIIDERPDGSIGIKYTTGKDKGKFERRTILKPELEPKIGLYPLEVFDDGGVHFGNEITEINNKENNQITTKNQENEKGDEKSGSQENGEKSGSQENGKKGNEKDDAEKNDVKVTSGEAKTEPVKPEKGYLETQKAIKDKAYELAHKKNATNKKLKDQKADILDQMQEVRKALNGEKDDEALDRVRNAGYDIEDGEPVRHSNDKKSSKIVFHVKNDGIFKISADWLIDDSAEKQVKKAFPTDIDKQERYYSENISNDKTGELPEQKPGKPGNASFGEYKRDLTAARDNVAEAERTGNKKMAAFWKGEVDRIEKLNLDYTGKEAPKPLEKLPISEHSDTNKLLKELHGINIQDLKDANDTQRDESGETATPSNVNAETVQQPENDGAGNAGKDRPGESTERGKGKKGKATFKKPPIESKVESETALQDELNDINSRLEKSNSGKGPDYIPASEKQKMIDRKNEIQEQLDTIKENDKTTDEKVTEAKKRIDDWVRRSSNKGTYSFFIPIPSKLIIKAAGEVAKLAVDGGIRINEALKKWREDNKDFFDAYKGKGYNDNAVHKEVLAKAKEAYNSAEGSNPFSELKKVWLGNIAVAHARANAEAANFQDEIQNTVQKGQKWKDVDQAIHIYLDLKRNPDHLDEFYDKLTDKQKKIVDLSQNLTDQQKDIADRIGKQYSLMSQASKDAGLINNILDNYVARVWDFKTNNIETMRKFGLSTKHSLQRSLDTILQGWAKGYELKINGATSNLAILKQEIANVIENRNLIDEGSKTEVNEDGDKLFTTNKLEGYSLIDHPLFKKWGFAGKIEHGDDPAKVMGKRKDIIVLEDGTILQKQDVYAPDNVAKRLNNIIGTSKLKGIKLIDNISKFNAVVKSTVLSTSLFHHLAFTRNRFLSGKASSGLNYKSGLDAMKQMTPEYEMLVRNGLTTGKIQDWDEGALQYKGVISKQLEKYKLTKGISDAISNLAYQNKHFLFERYGAGLKATDALTTFKREVEKNPYKDPNDIAGEVADAMNNNYGGLNLKQLERNPTTQHALQLLLLAPDWTESNLRMAAKAFKGGYEGDFTRRMWGKVFLRGASAVVLANLATSLLPDPNDDSNNPLERMKQRYSRAWDEGHLNWMNVNISPIAHAFGANEKKDFYFPLFGHYSDPLRLASSMVDPQGGSGMRFFVNKGSIITKLAGSALTSQDWRGNTYTNLDELCGLDDKGIYKKFVPASGDSPPHFLGEPKGGQLAGKLSSRKFGSAHPINAPQIPSFALDQAKDMMPLQVENTWDWATGQTDGFTALTNDIGFGIREATVPGAKTKGMKKP